MPTDENEDGVIFAVFTVEAGAVRAQDLRAKAEGYPQPGCIRGADYIREPTETNTRFAMQFWVGYDLEVIASSTFLSPEEATELTAIYELATDLPGDWAVGWQPGDG